MGEIFDNITVKDKFLNITVKDQEIPSTLSFVRVFFLLVSYFIRCSVLAEMIICIFSFNLLIGCITLTDYLLFALLCTTPCSCAALVFFFPLSLLNLTCHCLKSFVCSFNLLLSVDKFIGFICMYFDFRVRLAS